jgi:hypothetical protein
MLQCQTALLAIRRDLRQRQHHNLPGEVPRVIGALARATGNFHAEAIYFDPFGGPGRQVPFRGVAEDPAGCEAGALAGRPAGGEDERWFPPRRWSGIGRTA